MNNVLVTGCCGTTGTSLVKYLLDNTDDNIYGVDNFYKDGSKENLEEIRLYDKDKRFFFNEKDITSEAFYQDLNSFEGVTIAKIYNLAAIVETPRFYDSPYETFKVNCDGAIKLFEWACTHGVEKFVNASSSEIYGHQEQFPTKESNPNHYDAPEVSTRWSYAHGKILTEYIMNQLAERYGTTKVCHLRYANVYGEHDISPVHVVPYFLTQLVNKKEIHVNKEYTSIRRTFLHNDDSTLGTYLAMENMINGHAYNIGSQEEVSINQLLGTCMQILHDEFGIICDSKVIPDIVRAGDPTRRKLDTSRAHKELGFECKVSLAEGIRRTAERIIKEGKVE